MEAKRARKLRKRMYLYTDMKSHLLESNNNTNFEYMGESDFYNEIKEFLGLTDKFNLDFDVICENDIFYRAAMDITQDPHLICVRDKESLLGLVLDEKFVRHVYNPPYSFYSHSCYFNEKSIPDGITPGGRKCYFEYEEGYDGVVHIELDQSFTGGYNIFPSKELSPICNTDGDFLRILSIDEIKRMPMGELNEI